MDNITPESTQDMIKVIIARIQDLGIIDAQLSQLAKLDVMKSLSKHDGMWNPEDLEEADETLNDLRCILVQVLDVVEDCLGIIRRFEN